MFSQFSSTFSFLLLSRSKTLFFLTFDFSIVTWSSKMNNKYMGWIFIRFTWKIQRMGVFWFYLIIFYHGNWKMLFQLFDYNVFIMIKYQIMKSSALGVFPFARISICPSVRRCMYATSVSPLLHMKKDRHLKFHTNTS